MLVEEVVDFEDWMVSEDQPDGITVSVRFNAPGSAAAQAGPLALGGGVVSILGGMNLASERILLEHPEVIAIVEAIEGIAFLFFCFVISLVVDIFEERIRGDSYASR